MGEEVDICAALFAPEVEDNILNAFELLTHAITPQIAV